MAKQDQFIRLLLVEDSAEDAEQVVSQLRNGGMAVRPVRDWRAGLGSAVMPGCPASWPFPRQPLPLQNLCSLLLPQHG